MLRGAFAALLVVALGVTGAATAQNVVLSAREARSELFGVRLSGFNERISAPWTECIEPSGRTVYDYVGARRGGVEAAPSPKRGFSGTARLCRHDHQRRLRCGAGRNPAWRMMQTDGAVLQPTRIGNH